MKRTLFCIALISLHFAAAGQAIIPFVGGNISSQASGDYYSSKPVMGFNAGAIADIKLSTMFSWQAGLQYSLSRGKTVLAHPGLAAPAETVYRADAIQLPVMLTLKIGEEDDGRFFAGAGFYVAKNIAGTYKGKVEFGLSAGAGYHFINGLELYAFTQRGYLSQGGLSVRYALKRGGNKTTNKPALR
jgi:hypothetical protein